MSIYSRTFAYFRPFLWPTLVALLLSTAGIAFNLLKPWPFKIIIDNILSDKGPVPFHAQLESWFGTQTNTSLVVILCVGLVIIHLAGALLGLVTNYIFVKVGLAGLLNLRTELFAYLQSLPLKYHDTRRSSDSSFRVAYDSQAIQTIYNKGFTNIFSSTLVLISTLAVMFSMDWLLTLISMAILPGVIIAIRYYGQRIRKQSTTIQERESAVLTIAQEGLSSIRLIHAFGREQHAVDQFREQAHSSMEANLKLTTTNMISSVAMTTLMAIGTAALYLVGSLSVLHGQLSLGSLFVFSTYLTMLYQPIESLTYTAWALEGAAAGAQRCFEVLDKEDEVKDLPGAKNLPECRGEVRFENVEFHYSEAQPIIREVNLSVKPGTTVAFVGGTGAGKSTLLSLVPRFYDPTQGRVLLDERDLKTLTKKSIRSHISIVLQDTLLFSTTIRENIAYGRPDATEEQIREAAKQAQADDFINRTPEGYESQVGERGGFLSVGQRQRIGIARAFLKNSPILLLDEPTSALDPETENAIMQTLETLMKGRTTLIITHRLATIHQVDQIVVLEHGTVAEQGTGPELLARAGTYARLYKSGNYG